MILCHVQECLNGALAFAAVVNAVEARVFAKPQEIQGAAICRQGHGLCFWDTQGVVLVDFVPPGHTVNADYYCTLLSDRLRPAIRRK